MRKLVGYFIQGLVFLTPVALTVYICVVVFQTIDGWLGLPIPGAGFAITIFLITLIGFLASNLLTRGAVSVLDQVLNRLPFVKLLYQSTKDLVEAVAGDKRRFDKPVLVRLHEGESARTLGFVTHASLERLGMAEFVSVYLPFSYSIAGRVYLFRAQDVEPVSASSVDVMTFLVSGGVTEVPRVDGRAASVRP